MGPVERAIREAFPSGQAELTTISRGARFAIRIEEKGLRLFLGARRTPTLLTWPCLEGIPGDLRGKGWVEAGGWNSVDAKPGTLDEYLKKECSKTNTARWIAAVLFAAGVVEVRMDPNHKPAEPLQVRLTPRFLG